MENYSVQNSKLFFVLIYFSAVLSGISWTIVPSFGDFFTDSKLYELSKAEYGYLNFFLNIGAILTCALLFVFKKKNKLIALWIAGILIMTFSQIAIPISFFSFFLSKIDRYLLICVSEFALGVSLALVISTLIVILPLMFRTHTATAITAFYACISIGSAITPYVIIFFSKFVSWEIIPLFNFGLLAINFFLLIRIKNKKIDTSNAIVEINFHILKNVKVYSFFVLILIYGFIETTFSYWAPVFLHNKGTTIEVADTSISLFWGSFAVGQIITSIAVYRISPKLVFGILTSTIAIASLWLWLFDYKLLVAYVVGGVGCSSTYPLIIHFFENKFPKFILFSSGWVIGFYFLSVAITSLLLTFQVQLHHILISNLYSLTFFAVMFLIIVALFIIFKKQPHAN